jgi:hypothetical protein
MFIILKPFLSISEQQSDFIVIGYYSHYRIKIYGNSKVHLQHYKELKDGFELTDEEFNELTMKSAFYKRLNSLELIDTYDKRCEFSKSRRLSFYSLFTNKPFKLLTELKKISVTIIGCGGLGCRLAIELAASGFRNFKLIDNDILDTSNLDRMFWFSISDVGKFKTLLTREFLESRYEDLQIETFEKRFNEVSNMPKENAINIFSADDDNGYFINGNREKLSLIKGISIFCGYSESFAFAGPIYKSLEDYPFEGNHQSTRERIIPPSIGYINSLITGVVVNDLFLLLTQKTPLLSDRKWTYDILTGNTNLIKLS